MRRGRPDRVSWAALVVAVIALVMATTGIGAARSGGSKHSGSSPKGRVVRLDAHGRIPVAELPKIPVSELPAIPASRLPTIPASKLPKLTAAQLPQIPASKLPVTASVKHAGNADRLGGKSEAQLVSSCPAGAADLGTWCLDQMPVTLKAADVGQNNYAFATRTCESQGGYLPSAAQLIGAANKVPLESVLTDNPKLATIDIDPTDGLSDQREMSSTLVTTAAGSDAAGSEGVSPESTGNPKVGAPNPTPVPAVPYPATLQYVTVYDNAQKGGFAGSEPVSAPENFRCAFNKVSKAAQTTPAKEGTTGTGTTGTGTTGTGTTGTGTTPTTTATTPTTSQVRPAPAGK
jgi:hypothetical protein